MSPPALAPQWPLSYVIALWHNKELNSSFSRMWVAHISQYGMNNNKEARRWEMHHKEIIIWRSSGRNPEGRARSSCGWIAGGCTWLVGGHCMPAIKLPCPILSLMLPWSLWQWMSERLSVCPIVDGTFVSLNFRWYVKKTYNILWARKVDDDVGAGETLRKGSMHVLFHLAFQQQQRMWCGRRWTVWVGCYCGWNGFFYSNIVVGWWVVVVEKDARVGGVIVYMWYRWMN